ncbi:MAG: CoA transferase [Deltaproteobacteria bacterium]|nr:CoA transferase [Deltaproteobacteria bacterium]
MSEQALSGIKVIDLAEGISGSYCAKLMADFGADVIKVEAPNNNDGLRKVGPFKDDDPSAEKSGTFFYLNTNKKSVTIDLTSNKGQDIFKKLVKDTDVVIESFEPGKMADMGLSYNTLQEINPNLVMTSITWFGQNGPYRDFKATNFTAFGLAGAMYMMRQTRWPDTRPTILGGKQAEYTAGLIGYIVTMAAVISPVKGTWIDLSVMEALASTLTGVSADYSYIGLSRRTLPWAIHGFPTQENYPCKDGFVNLTPGLGGTKVIADLIEKPEERENPLLVKAGARVKAPEKFEELVLPWLKEHKKWEITEKAQKLKLAFAPILSPKELLDDPQLKAREFFVKTEHPEMGEVTYPGAPAKLSETPWKAGRAPLMGEHTEEILTDIGYTKSDLTALADEGII